MEEYLDYVDRVDLVNILIRRPAVIRDRNNPFVFYDEDEFVARFRFRKYHVMDIMEILGNELNPTQRKLASVSPMNQLLLTLRFYATGTFQIVDADLFGVHQCTVSRVIKKVSRVLASKIPKLCDVSSGQFTNSSTEGFFRNWGDTRCGRCN